MSAKSVRGRVIGYHQGHELLQALEKAGLTSDLTQEIIASRGNRSARAMLAALSGAVLTDDRFQLVKSFGIVVPADYDYSTRLDTFRAAHEKEFYYYHPNITDANYNKPSLKLSPGLKFGVKVFQITETVTSEDCLKFIKSQPKGVLLGAQGASLVYEQKKDQLPKGRWHASFDEKENLWQDSGGYRRVPYVYAHSDGDFGFRLGGFESSWDADYCLLCFCDNN